MLLWISSVLQTLCRSLWWSLRLSLHFSLVWCLQHNLWQCLLILGQVSWSLRCFVLPVCVCLRVRLQLLTLSLRCRAGAGVTFIAQILHVKEPLHQTLDKFCWRCLWALTEAGHREDNVVWLRIVARSISVWNHRSVAAEHLNSSRNLRGGLLFQFWATDSMFTYWCRWNGWDKTIEMFVWCLSVIQTKPKLHF